MLKWQGDFTLPRLRAKLANKYLLHPSVEPEYTENYRPDLSQTVVSRRDLVPCSPYGAQSPAGNRTWDVSRSQAQFGSTSLTNLHATSGPSGLNVTGFASKSGFDSTSSLRGGKELPHSMKPPKRTRSVPTLGTRRALVAPASLRPLPPGQQPLQGGHSHKSFTPLSSTAEPGEPPSDDPRQMERERQIEAACVRFWRAANGNQHYLAEEVAQIRLEDPSVTNAQILNRLKTTQACVQMNKARRDGARIDWRNEEWDGATLLLKAVRTGAMALAMHLIAIGADPMLVDYTGRGLLHWVAIEGDAAMATYIFDTVTEWQPDVPDQGGDTPLHLAAYHGHLPIVRMLIRNGADPTRENAGGFTPLQLAEVKRMWHVTSYLAEYRMQQEDQNSQEGIAVKYLLRPCNQNRAKEVAKDAASQPQKK